MKLKKTLSAFGLIAVAASGVLIGPPDSAVANSTNALDVGVWQYQNPPTLQPGQVAEIGVKTEARSFAASPVGTRFDMMAPSGTTWVDAGVHWEERRGGVGDWTFGSATCSLSAEARLKTCDLPNFAMRASTGVEQSMFIMSASLRADSNQMQSGLVQDGWFTYTGGAAFPVGTTASYSYLAVPSPVAPAVKIDAFAVQQGERVDVPVEFNRAIPGEMQILLPKGLSPAGAVPPGFTYVPDENIFTGTVSGSNLAFTMHLRAAEDAPVGEDFLTVYGGGVNKRVSTTITAARVDPAVTIKSVTVRQRESVDVPVTFNESVSGHVEIVVPNGLSPVGNAPAGFTWLPSMNGFSGMVTDANRAFTMHLQAAADAPVGTFDGVVRGGGLNQAWSATITAGVPVPDKPVVLTSPAIGAELKPGAPVFSGTGQAGATIQVYSAAQALLGETEVLSNGTWSLTWNTSLTPGRYSGGSVRQYVGAKPYTSVPYDFTVKDTEVAPLTVTSPKVGETIEETTPVFTGTAQPGAKVEIRGVSGGLLGSVDRVASNGQWTITWNKSVLPARYVGGTVKQFVSGVERGKFTYDFTVAGSNVAPLVVTSPTVGATISEPVPVFTGRAQPGARVEIRGAWGDLLGSVDRVASTGQWSITWNKSVLPARYVGGTVKQFVDGVERGSFAYDFTVIASQLVVTSPKVGETISGTRPVFTGTATPKAEIQIRGGWGTDLGHAVANDRGEWSITWPSDYLPAHYSGGTVTESVNGKVIGSFAYDFFLVK